MKTTIILFLLTLSLAEETIKHRSKHKLRPNNFHQKHKDAHTKAHRHPRFRNFHNIASSEESVFQKKAKTTKDIIRDSLADSYSGEDDKFFDITSNKPEHFLHVPSVVSETTAMDIPPTKLTEETATHKMLDISYVNAFDLYSNVSLHTQDELSSVSITQESTPIKKRKTHTISQISFKGLTKLTTTPVYPGMNTFRRGKPVLYPPSLQINESNNDSRRPSNVKSTTPGMTTVKQTPSTYVLQSTLIITTSPEITNDSAGENYRHLTTPILPHRVFDALIVSNRSYKELTHGEPEAESELKAGAEPMLPQQEYGTYIPPFAEPGPEWNLALNEWKEAWDIHVYLVGGLFSLLGFFSLFNVIHFKCVKHLLSKGYFLTLNFMIIIMAASRTIYMFWDPYNSKGILPRPAAYLLLNIGYPALTSAFSILLLSLLKSTKVHIFFSKIQSPLTLGVIIFFHFMLSIATDLVVGFILKAKLMMLASQIVFLVWGLLLFLGYLYIFQTLYKAGLQRQKELMREDITKLYPLEGNPVLEPPKPTLCLALKVTLVASLMGILIIVLKIYGMIQVFNIFSHEKPEPWLWWSYELSFRLCELGMCFLICYIASQPFRYEMNARSWHDCCLCRCCGCCDMDRRSPWSIGYMRQATRSRSCDSDILQNHIGLKLPDTDQTDYSLPMQEIAGQKGLPNGHTGKASTTSSYGSSRSSRPQSMLYMENGFVRFRGDDDPEQEPIDFSPDEESPINGDLDNVTLTSYHSLPNDEETSPSNENPDSSTCSPVLNKRKRLDGDEGNASEFGFRMPSSINLNASIEQAMNELVSRTFAKVPSDLSIQSEHQNSSAVSLHSLYQNKLSPYNTLSNMKQAHSFNELNKNETDKNRKSKQYLPQLRNSNVSLNPSSNGYQLLDNDDVMIDPDSPEKIINKNDSGINYVTVNGNYNSYDVYEADHFKIA